MEIYFATRNPHKVREAREILRRFNIKFHHLDVEYPEIQSDSLSEIASEGARYVAERHGRDVFVEDAGLFIDALKGFPGPYSSYVYETIGGRGVLKALAGVSNREATFRSVVAFCERGGRLETFMGEALGHISLEERGTHGFAFDSIFIPREGDGRTFSEMSIGEKNEISHRRKSLEKFARWLIEEAL
ncbi:MAG: XTP/dITP diphosphatase [Candidatus Geothermarchaeales archaeon]